MPVLHLIIAFVTNFAKNYSLLFQNIWLGIRAIFFRVPSLNRINLASPQFSAWQLGGLIVFNQIIQISYHRYAFKVPVEFNPSAIPLMLTTVGMIFLWGYLVLSKTHRQYFVALMIGLISMSFIVNVIQIALQKTLPTWQPIVSVLHPKAPFFIYYFPFFYFLISAAYLSIKWMGRRWVSYPWWLFVWSIFGIASYYLATQTAYQPWFYAIENYEAEEPPKNYTPAYRESILYQQPQLLEKALANITTGKPNTPELFFVGFAGDATQDVFMREVLSVKTQFAKQFNTAQHNILLINNLATLDDYPMASVTALKKTLKTIGERMNPEDVLFLFMTSHGSREHQFYLSFGNYEFEILNPSILKNLLDQAHIKNRVLVISACYSGGFIPELTNDNTLIMTAARADRTSFGCSNENDWTYFGHALFAHGLKKTNSLIEAFKLARQEVSEREKTLQHTPSEPQIYIGKNIPKILKSLE